MATLALGWTYLVIGLALVVYTWTLVAVGNARRKSGIKSPATTGDVTLERALRVQQNTLEQLIVFLPAIVLFANLVDGLAAAALGLIWVIGRVLYIPAYMREPESRGPGFTIAFVPQIILVLGSIAGAVYQILRG
ncbi:MAG: MAPEG family protein [Alphaproteobacteria bacterium]|nr:MAPEG family protein [Alphaproteobacteria bacterium]